MALVGEVDDKVHRLLVKVKGTLLLGDGRSENFLNDLDLKRDVELGYHSLITGLLWRYFELLGDSTRVAAYSHPRFLIARETTGPLKMFFGLR